jgi:hypothetical protein
MLSSLSRSLTYLNAALYAILGAWLFFMPEQLAPVFAWKVTPFMTMTIGGWCLGNAWLALFIARRWKWEKVFVSLFYLWIFGVGELLVLYFFREKVVLKHPVAWLYLVTLLVNAAAAYVGVVEVIRKRPALIPAVLTTNSLQYILLAGFVVFVGFLGIYGSTVPVGAPGTNGGIFPEIMSLFTLRSFGVFYLSLALSVLPLLRYRNLAAYLSHGFISYGLIVFITSAAFVYLRLFDFAAKPGGLLYIGAYAAVGVVFLLYFWKYGTGN